MVQPWPARSVTCFTLRQSVAASGHVYEQHVGLIPIRAGQFGLGGDVDAWHAEISAPGLQHRHKMGP
jgi:hypothetical protein